MPLPPLPENATARVWIDYTSVGLAHSIMFRLGAGASATTASTKAQTLAALLALRMLDVDSFQSARWSDIGSSFSLPITFTTVVGSGGPLANAWAQDPESAQLSLVGRGGTTARKVRWEFFTGLKTPAWPGNNRYNPGDTAVIDTLRINFTSWVNTAASPGEQPVTIGGDIPTVYSYVNICSNAYTQRKQR